MKKFLTAFIIVLGAASAQAQSPYQPTPSSDNHDYVVPYIGWFDLTQGDDQSVQFGVEYRFAPRWMRLRPGIGFNTGTDGGWYGYGGVFWDIPLTEVQGGNLLLTPNFVAGIYEDGGGKDLGGPVEFRSGIELSYQLPNMHRIGIAFNHISNASIYDRNPGAETLLINYHIPLGRMF